MEKIVFIHAIGSGFQFVLFFAGDLSLVLGIS
jgi:hypothetical protein